MTAAPKPVLDDQHEHEQRPPDLQELVRAHGGYDRITPEAWANYDRELADWRLRTAAGDFWWPPYRYYRYR
jgi:hypothetical protein